MYDPTQPPSPWEWRTAWKKLAKKAGLEGLRLHDLRHHCAAKLAESAETSEETIKSIFPGSTQATHGVLLCLRAAEPLD
jgi:integrase